MKNRIILLSVISFLLLFPRQAPAQNLPPSQQPGAQAERFLKDSEQKKDRLEKKKAKAPEIQVEEKVAPAAGEGISFILKGIKLSGNTLFTAEDIRPAYSSTIGKKVTYGDLNQIIETIKAKYKKKGYLTTSAYLPEQEIKDGVVEIRIVEGKLGNLKVEGNKNFLTSWIKKYIHVKKNDLLNVNMLQRDILRLNQNPDLTIKATLSQGEAPETSDITLKATEKFPAHLGVSFDNQGTRLVGKLRGGTYLRVTNLTGQGDSIFVNSVLSTLSCGQSISYAIPIGTYGTKAGLDVTYFETKIGKEFKSFDITGNTQIYTPHLSWELALREDLQVTMDMGLEIKSIINKAAGVQTSDDQMRLPYFGFNVTKTDTFGQNLFAPRVTFGTSGFLGSSSRNHPSASRAGTGGEFVKYEQTLARVQRMPFESYLSIRSQFQAASRTLPSSEQFQLGGANSVRGYPEGDYSCDMGGFLSTDWVMPMYLIPKNWQLSGSDTPLRHQIEPVLFADIGGGDLKKVLQGESRNKFLAGIGVGLRLHFNDKFSVRLDWAKRVGNGPLGNSGPSTFYFSFQSEI